MLTLTALIALPLLAHADVVVQEVRNPNVPAGSRLSGVVVKEVPGSYVAPHNTQSGIHVVERPAVTHRQVQDDQLRHSWKSQVSFGAAGRARLGAK